MFEARVRFGFGFGVGVGVLVEFGVRVGLRL